MSEEKLKKQILSGKIFIYPTDTIYGLYQRTLIIPRLRLWYQGKAIKTEEKFMAFTIGCNALDEKAVAKIKVFTTKDMKKFLY